MTREHLFNLLETDRDELIDIARGHQMLGRDEMVGITDDQLLLWIKGLSENELEELN